MFFIKTNLLIRILLTTSVIFSLCNLTIANDLNWQNNDLSKFFEGDPINQSIAQEIQAEESTFHSIGIRWPIVGDANANAKVSVRYKSTNSNEFKSALPLFRTLPYKNSPENRVKNGWLFAGSILNLKQNTSYEINLSLQDPDGGSVNKTIEVNTYSEPVIPSGMINKHVYPLTSSNNYKIKNKSSIYYGLKKAEESALPGDLFLLHAGTYKAGEWQLKNHGTASKPIIYKNAGDGEVILDGQNSNRLLNADKLKYVWFEGITFANAKYLIVAHNGSNLVLRNNIFKVKKAGFVAINGGPNISKNIIITDNKFLGTTSWPRTKGIESIKGVEVTGSGHVIAHNYFSNLGDAIHGSQHGGLSSSDIYNNDIFICTDDGIETDYSDTNVRVYNNRITNTFAGITTQPVNGGPVYIFRNSIYNTQYSPFKLHNHTSGLIIANNTSATHGIAFNIKNAGEEVSNVFMRNNLFIGGKDYGLRSVGKMIACDFDNDGYGGFSGMFGWSFALWNGKEYTKPKHALGSDGLYSKYGAIVINPKKVFKKGKITPKFYDKTYAIEDNRFELAEQSSAIDSGLEIPTITEHFTGAKPDLGCCESGIVQPHYGPRDRYQ